MPLSEIDRNLLERCLKRRPRAWEDFVDRFLGLVVHVVNCTAKARGIRVSPNEQDSLCAEVFLSLMEDDFRLLRQFHGRCSLAVYLVVVGRRIVEEGIGKRRPTALRNKDTAQRGGRSVVNGKLNPKQRSRRREQGERVSGQAQANEEMCDTATIMKVSKR